MIELLVVVTIIAILMTLTLQVVGGLLSQARDTATRTTQAKIQTLLNTRSQAFDRLIKRRGYLVGSADYATIQGTYSKLPQSTQLILTVKSLEMKYFPQRPVETNSQLQPAVANNSNASSIEILYDFLTQSNVLGNSPLGTDNFTSAEVQDVDKDGLPEFIDAWGKPMRFYRWPTRFFRSQGQTGANAVGNFQPQDLQNARNLFSTLPSFSGSVANLKNDLGRDPDDPLQELLTNFSNYERQGFATPATFHVLLVVSAGPDGIFGMGDPSDTGQQTRGDLGAVVDPQALLDDIISLNTRAGGK